MMESFELSPKTKSMIVPTLIAMVPIIPGGIIMIPRFIKQLYDDVKGQWTGIRLYDRCKESKRIYCMYGIMRVD